MMPDTTTLFVLLLALSPFILLTTILLSALGLHLFRELRLRRQSRIDWEAFDEWLNEKEESA